MQSVVEPRLTILAGSNGARKSTLARFLRLDGEFVNVDEIARQIDPTHPERVSVTAARRAIARLTLLMEEGRDFVFETTLSSRHSVSLLRKARSAGFEIGLVFVVLERVDLAIARVNDRVRMGGHHVPASVIRRRFDAILGNLGVAMAIADATIVYDNSDRIGPGEILRVSHGKAIFQSLDPALAVHRRIESAYNRSLALRGTKDRFP